MDRIQVTYEVAHSIAQGKNPERTVQAKKKYNNKEDIESAEILLDSEVPATCDSVAQKLGDSEIRVNPNDLTVFQVNFKA